MSAAVGPSFERGQAPGIALAFGSTREQYGACAPYACSTTDAARSDAASVRCSKGSRVSLSGPAGYACVAASGQAMGWPRVANQYVRNPASSKARWKVGSADTRAPCPGQLRETSKGTEVWVASAPAVTSHATSAPACTARTPAAPPHSCRKLARTLSPMSRTIVWRAAGAAPRCAAQEPCGLRGLASCTDVDSRASACESARNAVPTSVALIGHARGQVAEG